MTSEAAVEITKGPDLQQGIPVSDLADGGMVAGHVGEDAVLLVRKGDQFLALDAVCTHYGAPLADGALVGETLRCPGHHACLSKDHLAGRAPQEWIPLRGETHYAADHVDLRVHVTVDRIDPRRREVRLATNERLTFDRRSLQPAPHCGVWTSRSIPRRDFTTCTWAHADALRGIADAVRKVVIIGSGFIGLEATASLRDRGLDVTVVGRDDQPLQTVLGREVGDFVRRTHEAHGVRFRLGRQPAAIHGNRVVLDDGSIEQADAVIAAIGVEPDVALAAQAGLAVDRGIRRRCDSPAHSPRLLKFAL